MTEKGARMSFKNVLVPYDGSDHARSALEIAKGMIGADTDATLNVISVLTIPSDPFQGAPLGYAAMTDFMLIEPDSYEKTFRQNLEHTKDELKDNLTGMLDELDCQVKIDVMPDVSSVDGISAYVKQHDCDLIIMGRRGLGKVRGLLGSVSFGVLRAVDIPVMTVR